MRIMLVSGGLDSFLVSSLKYPWPRAVPVMARVDVPYFEDDYDAAQYLYASLVLTKQEVRVSEAVAMQTGFIPHRNLAILVAVAQEHPFVREIVVSSPLGTQVGDGQAAFFRAAGRALSAASPDGKVIRVVNGMRGHTKASMVREYLRQGLPLEMLYMTRSCYSAGTMHCGTCNACLQRWIAFTLNGLSEYWENDPLDVFRGQMKHTTAKDLAHMMLRAGVRSTMEWIRVGVRTSDLLRIGRNR